MPDFKCPECSATIEVEKEWDGLEAECPSCGKDIVISLDGLKHEPDGDDNSTKRRATTGGRSSKKYLKLFAGGIALAVLLAAAVFFALRRNSGHGHQDLARCEQMDLRWAAIVLYSGFVPEEVVRSIPDKISDDKPWFVPPSDSEQRQVVMIDDVVAMVGNPDETGTRPDDTTMGIYKYYKYGDLSLATEKGIVVALEVPAKWLREGLRKRAQAQPAEMVNRAVIKLPKKAGSTLEPEPEAPKTVALIPPDGRRFGRLGIQLADTIEVLDVAQWDQYSTSTPCHMVNVPNLAKPYEPQCIAIESGGDHVAVVTSTQVLLLSLKGGARVVAAFGAGKDNPEETPKCVAFYPRPGLLACGTDRAIYFFAAPEWDLCPSPIPVNSSFICFPANYPDYIMIRDKNENWTIVRKQGDGKIASSVKDMDDLTFMANRILPGVQNVSPDGRWVAKAAALDGKPCLELYAAGEDDTPAKILSTRTKFDDLLWCPSFAADSRYCIASCMLSMDNINVWEVESGRLAQEINVPKWKNPIVPAISPDGRWIAAAWGASIGVWERMEK